MPDVCRTYHFESGVHINKAKQKRYFETHSFNKDNKLYQLQTEKYVIYLSYFHVSLSRTTSAPNRVQTKSIFKNYLNIARIHML